MISSGFLQGALGGYCQEQIIGNTAAAKLLKREYRAPWKHPYKNAT